MWNSDEIREWADFVATLNRLHEDNEKINFFNVKQVLRLDRPGQFIWELVQNAEDAGATKVEIELGEKNLIFKHNGIRNFTLSDAKSIARIGSSNKSRDLDSNPKIGQFGVGFKSVFKYAGQTGRVEIHSGDLHFSIQNYSKIENGIQSSHIINTGEFPTQFFIGFADNLITNNQAFSEIIDELIALDYKSIIFLSHIKTIEVIAPNNKLHISKKNDGNVVSIKCTDGKSENITKWKMWSKNVESHTFDGQGNITATRASNVAIAINISNGEENKARYMPVEGEVFTFFPLSDHPANLKFHIHGPFAINLERTNLQESTPLAKEENNRLISEISTLLASAVQSDLETNIDLDILALMPIESDNSSPRFKIITESVSTLLSQFSLIKDIRGTRRTSVELLMIGSSLENLLIDSNLEEILSVTSKSDIEGKHVAIFRRTSNSRINSFLQHVGVGIVGDKELKMYFTRINDAFTLQKNVTPYTKSNLPIPSNLQMYKKIVDTFKNWINSKTDLQITKLLLALGKSRIETNNLASIPLCPAYNEDKNIIFEKIPNLRIPSRPEDTGAGVISRSIYDLAKVEENRTVYKELGEFFNFHEIKVNDEWNYLEKELKRAGTALNIDDELKRVGKFIEIWKQDPSRFQAKARQNLRLYGRFVGKVESFNAEKLNLNFTIGNKKLSQFSGSIKSDDEVPIVIDDYYALDDFAEFAKAIGVKDQLTYFVNDKRYITLPFLKEMLLSGDIPIYRDLWISLLNINQPTAFKFLANGRRYPTHLLEELESYAWVPDRNSNLQLLEDISSDNIHPEFPISNCHFIAESSFGRSKEEFERNSAEKIDIATKAGFQNVQKMELARKIAEQNSFEELEKFLKKESLPGPEVLFDPNNITIEELEKLAPDIMKSPELVEKRRNYREAQQARRSRLREIYGDSGSMICQLCHKEMPFKYPESENSIYWDYFETVSFFISAKKESERNALALCPVCSAKVQHFRKKFPDFRDKYLAEQVIRCFENQTLYMKVQFFGDSHILKFNQQHINDLHAVVVANDL